MVAGLLGLAMTSSLSGTARAAEETVSSTASDQQFEDAFARMMKNPADIAATMDYANIAVSRENYEAAIPALERLLFFNPDLPDIKLRLGILYFKLGSYDVARDYLNSASAPDAPQDIVDKASSYLAKMGG